MAAHFGWKVHQLDIKTAFLNGELQQEVYVTQPIGFVKLGQEHQVCCLKRLCMIWSKLAKLGTRRYTQPLHRPVSVTCKRSWESWDRLLRLLTSTIPAISWLARNTGDFCSLWDVRQSCVCGKVSRITGLRWKAEKFIVGLLLKMQVGSAQHNDVDKAVHGGVILHTLYNHLGIDRCIVLPDVMQRPNLPRS